MIRVWQFVLSLCGISFVLWVCFDSQFRDVEGFPDPGICLPVVGSVALIMLACALSSNWKKSAFWFALALIGQAVALQMIEAGPLLRYQHYKPLNRLLTETHPLLLIFLALQTVLVVAGLRERWQGIQAWLRKNFNGWQLFGIILGFVLTSATVSRDIFTYGSEMIFAAFVQAVNLATIVLMVWAIPQEKVAWLAQMFKRLFGQPGVEDQERELEKTEIQSRKFARPFCYSGGSLGWSFSSGFQLVCLPVSSSH